MHRKERKGAEGGVEERRGQQTIDWGDDEDGDKEERRAEEGRRRRGEGRIDCGDDEDDDGEDRRENLWGENYCLTSNQVGLLRTANHNFFFQ